MKTKPFIVSTFLLFAPIALAATFSSGTVVLKDATVANDASIGGIVSKSNVDGIPKDKKVYAECGNDFVLPIPCDELQVSNVSEMDEHQTLKAPKGQKVKCECKNKTAAELD